MSGVIGKEIVIGIDFGATHSGVSWALNAGGRDILSINSWPNPRARTATTDQVPSVISYSNGKAEKWGYAMGPTDTPVKWFKVLLDTSHKYSEADMVMRTGKRLADLGKTPVEVISDYLKCIWDFALKDIRRKRGENFEKNHPLTVTLTVPAVWSQTARLNTLKAAKNAGLPDDIRLIPEPEAAALAVLKDRGANDDLKEGDAFVVCDAGGGTVDLISYRIEKLDPLEIRECATGDGDFCGSMFLDIGFEKHISVLVGPDKYKTLKPHHVRKMLEDFEFGIKRCFTEVDDNLLTVELIGVPDDPSSDIKGETIKIARSTLCTIFDGVCCKIQELVESQISAAKERGVRVKAILLVGGFGESKYLFDRLSAANKEEGVAVLQESRGWSAVCRGATLWGLERCKTGIPPTITTRIARRSYGLVIDAQENTDNNEMCEDCRAQPKEMMWLLRRGDEIKYNEPVKLERSEDIRLAFFKFKDRTFQTKLYYCKDNSPPLHQGESVKLLCTLEYSVPYLRALVAPKAASKEGDWRRIEYHIEILFGNTMMDYSMVYNDRTVANVEVKYEDIEERE